MRIDYYLVSQGYFDSRTKAKQAIERGEVFLNGKAIVKSSLDVNDKDMFNVEITSPKSFVSLGGYNLDKALDDFDFSVTGLRVADIGASTGGFTDCLLQRGAERVFAVDVSDSLLHNKLQKDSRVISIIKNARELTCTDFDCEIDLIVADLSFISATYVMDTFYNLIKSNKNLILLIKPQFEVGSKVKFKNGIIRDEKIRERACKSVIDCALDCGFKFDRITTAPIVNQKNVEYLALFTK